MGSIIYTCGTVKKRKEEEQKGREGKNKRLHKTEKKKGRKEAKQKEKEGRKNAIQISVWGRSHIWWHCSPWGILATFNPEQILWMSLVFGGGIYPLQTKVENCEIQDSVLNLSVNGYPDSKATHSSILKDLTSIFWVCWNLETGLISQWFCWLTALSVTLRDNFVTETQPKNQIPL